MDAKEYCELIGRLVTNLLSLEFAMRAVLAKHNEAREPQGDFWNAQPGDSVPENSLTDYRSLGQVVDGFNATARAGGSSNLVDRSVVGIRDMLAHGRILALEPRLPWTLFKFGSPTDGKVPVEARQVLDEDWLRAQVGWTREQVLGASAAAADLGHGDVISKPEPLL
jgi:hypothetical protein